MAMYARLVLLDDEDDDWDVLLALHDMWPSGAEAGGEKLLPWLIRYSL
jgi:hypothetical protein